MTQDYGTVDYKGLTLTITQQPYADSDKGESFYRANAQDQDENEYEIWWPVVNEDCEDESDACDWEDYKVVELF